jgi:hypothetical protein
VGYWNSVPEALKQMAKLSKFIPEARKNFSTAATILDVIEGLSSKTDKMLTSTMAELGEDIEDAGYADWNRVPARTPFTIQLRKRKLGLKALDAVFLILLKLKKTASFNEAV